MIDLRNETFGGTFPFAPHYLHVNGFDMHFVDEGDGDSLLFLHGDPTWGYLWRNIVAPLSKSYRCIAPDQMGMGKSGNPRAPNPYRLQHHAANFEAFVIGLDLRNITLVLHDWGGPVGLHFAIRHRSRIKRLVLMNTWACAPCPGGPFPKLLEIIRSTRGEKFVLEKNGYVGPAMLWTTYHSEKITPMVLSAYLAPYPTPEFRLAPLCWSRDIPVNESDPSYADMKRIECSLPELSAIPTLLIWGMRDPVLPPAVLKMWQGKFPKALTVEIEDASHFLQEDAPERIVSSIKDFLKDGSTK